MGAVKDGKTEVDGEVGSKMGRSLGSGGIKKYIFEKLFFPKVVRIDEPGVIYNVVAKKFGRNENKKRMVWHFEDVIVELQKETIKNLGIEKTRNLWYKIGKDAGTRYMLFGGIKSCPKIMMGSVVNYVMENFRGSGASLIGDVSYDCHSNHLVLNGKNNFVCRKSGICSVDGTISAVLSCLSGRNIEAKMECSNCPDGCRLIANPEIPQKYVPDLSELALSKNYSDNFKCLFFEENRNYVSFDDLIRFKKINFERNKIKYLDDFVLIPTEIGSFELISHNYIKINCHKEFSSAMIRGSEKMFGKMFGNKRSVNEKICLLKTTLSGLGWGLVDIKISKNGLLLLVSNYPSSKYYPYGFIYLLNGFLNNIFDSKFEFKKMKKHGVGRVSFFYE